MTAEVLTKDPQGAPWIRNASVILYTHQLYVEILASTCLPKLVSVHTGSRHFVTVLFKAPQTSGTATTAQLFLAAVSSDAPRHIV